MRYPSSAMVRARTPRRVAGALLAAGALGLLAPAGGASATGGDPNPGPTPMPSPTPPRQQWTDEVGLSAASVCRDGDGWLAELVITWSTDNPNQPSTSFGLFGAPGMNPKYAGWNGDPANGTVTYDFAFSEPTNLMVNMVWGMAEGNEQAYLTVSPGQVGDCGDAETGSSTTAVAPSSSGPSSSSPSSGNSSNGSSNGPSGGAERLPSTGASAGMLAGAATVVVAAGLAVLGLARRRTAV